MNGARRWNLYTWTTGSPLATIAAAILFAGLGPAETRASIESVQSAASAVDVRFDLTFAPKSPFVEGWAFQIFIDADNDRTTGYGEGFELLIRGVGMTGAQSINLRDADCRPVNPDGSIDPTDPRPDCGEGGWGPTVDIVPFVKDDDWHVSLWVPVHQGGLATGSFRYSIEAYFDHVLRYRLTNQRTGGSDPNDGDLCPNDPDKRLPGQCGCGVPDVDNNGNGVADCLDGAGCATSTQAWQSFLFPPQSGRFGVTMEVTPHSGNMAGLIGLSQGHVQNGAPPAAMVRFHDDGLIDVWHGSLNWFDADVAFYYESDRSFLLSLDIDLTRNLYSVRAQTSDGGQALIAENYPLHWQGEPPTQLDEWGLVGATEPFRVCGFAAGDCLLDSDLDGVDDCADGCPADPQKVRAGLCGCGVIECPDPDAAALMFETFKGYPAGRGPEFWQDTDADNSMVENDDLFYIQKLGGDPVLTTNSELVNIHSHYHTPDNERWSSFEYRGWMMMSDTAGGIGVTFLSQYPEADVYYRLRSFDRRTFRLIPHPHHTLKPLSETIDTGVTPEPGVWYRFRIEVIDSDGRNEVRAKIWAEGQPEPLAWQASAYDDRPDRPTRGTVGVWSMGPGEKFWDDLAVQALQCDVDSDGDTVADSCDNCPDLPNVSQLDTDGDGVGDACRYSAIDRTIDDTIIPTDDDVEDSPEASPNSTPVPVGRHP